MSASKKLDVSVGRSHPSLKSPYLSRPAHGNTPAREKTFWQTDEVRDETDKKVDSYKPTRCPKCSIEIIFDKRNYAHCPDCGLIFPNPDKRGADNKLSYAIRKSRERDRKAREGRMPSEFRERELCERPRIDLNPISLGKVKGKFERFSECQYVSPDRQRAIDRLTWGLSPL